MEDNHEQAVDGFQYWPEPLSKEEEDLRKRAGRLLESLKRIPALYEDAKNWEKDHEWVFSLFRRGCLDGMTTGMLEAPIYHNRQIEDAWLFLVQMRQRHPNRRKQIAECTTSLGASYNWSIVLHGSKKVRAALEKLPPPLQSEILEAADASDLLASLALTTGGQGAMFPDRERASSGSTMDNPDACDRRLASTWPQHKAQDAGDSASWLQEGLRDWPQRPPPSPGSIARWPSRGSSPQKRSSGLDWAAEGPSRGPSPQRKGSSLDWASPANPVPSKGAGSKNPFGPAPAEAAAWEAPTQQAQHSRPHSPAKQQTFAPFDAWSPLSGRSDGRAHPAHGAQQTLGTGVGGEEAFASGDRSSPTSMFSAPSRLPNPHNPFNPKLPPQDPGHPRPIMQRAFPAQLGGALPPQGGHGEAADSEQRRGDFVDPGMGGKALASGAAAHLSAASRNVAASADKAASQGRRLASATNGGNIAAAGGGAASEASAAARSGMSAISAAASGQGFGAKTSNRSSGRPSSLDRPRLLTH